jgi:hypothetical protein
MDFPSHLFVVQGLEPLLSEDSSDIIVIHVELRPLMDNQSLDIRKVAKPMTSHGVSISGCVHWEPPSSLSIVSPFVVCSVADSGGHVPDSTTSRRVDRVVRHIYMNQVWTLRKSG